MKPNFAALAFISGGAAGVGLFLSQSPVDWVGFSLAAFTWLCGMTLLVLDHYRENLRRRIDFLRKR